MLPLKRAANAKHRTHDHARINAESKLGGSQLLENVCSVIDVGNFLSGALGDSFSTKSLLSHVTVVLSLPRRLLAYGITLLLVLPSDDLRQSLVHYNSGLHRGRTLHSFVLVGRRGGLDSKCQLRKSFY